MQTSLCTLCYIQKDNCYLMLHRVVKKNDVNKDKWIVSAAILRRTKARRTACCAKFARRPDIL